MVPVLLLLLLLSLPHVRLQVLVQEAHVALAAAPAAPGVLQQVVEDQDPLLPGVPEVLVEVDGRLQTRGQSMLSMRETQRKGTRL